MILLEISFTPYIPTSIVSLLGLALAYIFFYLKNKSDNKLKEIKSASSKDRLKAIEMYLNDLGVSVDTSNLNPAEKVKLIKQLINLKKRRYLIIATTIIIVSGFVIFLLWTKDNIHDKNKVDQKTDTSNRAGLPYKHIDTQKLKDKNQNLNINPITKSSANGLQKDNMEQVEVSIQLHKDYTGFRSIKVNGKDAVILGSSTPNNPRISLISNSYSPQEIVIITNSGDTCMLNRIFDKNKSKDFPIRFIPNCKSSHL
ncbi:MAG: hypothetical protein ABI691_08695 [Ginsengibacter sp.]